eukprot:CAMPEP_0177654526 /NCGR_PEP_ID=MMETSP0447-20121125/14386_1 /TAXON_ID=0 /ORGANISM="Stygamoeba regulata, Strain BSH-02190019" /LENGTH=369 /DNA_ID=CAMNT_0019158195 /DNA_START=513 /DNA_END=1622 /DNA_ORIENTATION=+
MAEKEDTNKKAQIKSALNSWLLGGDPDEEEEEVPIIREGLLKKEGEGLDKDAKKKRSLSSLAGGALHDRWFILVPGALYYYTNQNSKEPHGMCALPAGTKVDTEARKHRVEVVTDSQRLAFRCHDADDQSTWVSAIKGQVGKPAPDAPPTRSIAKKKSSLFSAKKKVSERAAMSNTGMALIRKHVNEDAVRILDLSQELLAGLAAPNQKRGKELYRNAFKVIMKSFMLMRSQYLTMKDFQKTQDQVLRLWKLALTHHGSANSLVPQPKSQQGDNYEVMVKILGNIRTSIVETLKAHLTPKTIHNRITPIFDFIAKRDTLQKLFESSDAAIKGPRDEIMAQLKTTWDVKVPAAMKTKVERLENMDAIDKD